jgi:L-ribulokinase
MSSTYIIGLDFGTESARGVLIDVVSGLQESSHAHRYRHGVITQELPNGNLIPSSYALQDASDYLEAAEAILCAIGSGRSIAGIGLDFTASSPLSARADGTALSVVHPGEAHAYVKLWKHAASQPYADIINKQGGAFLVNSGGRLSGEWLLAKAAEIAAEAPALWAETDRFIEAGDWLVWQLTGHEVRSLDFAAYKAHFERDTGYPRGVVPGLIERLGEPHVVGTPAGSLTPAWRARTGIEGDAIVAVAVIDSHVVLPAVGAVSSGSLVGALGTSAVFLLLDDRIRPFPKGIEAVAESAALPGLWCYEAGQAGFGDMLAWFVRTFPRADDLGENFRLYNQEAAGLAPGQNHLVALDWWSGNRVPYSDSGLSGLLAGLNLATTAAGIYRALLEALCYGARSIVDRLTDDGLPINHILLTSGLAHNNHLLVQIMADVLGREIKVPSILNPTAVGAAIHGAVAAGIATDFADGAHRFGAGKGIMYQPDRTCTAIYDELYDNYTMLSATKQVRSSMHALNRLESTVTRSDPVAS